MMEGIPKDQELTAARLELHKDLHELMLLLKGEDHNAAAVLLQALLDKYRPYEDRMPDDYGVLYEADFYLREGTSGFNDFLREYNAFLRRLYPAAE